MSDSLRVQTEILLSQRLQFGANGSPFLADCAILTPVSGHVTGFCREIRGFLIRPWSIWPSEVPRSLLCMHATDTLHRNLHNILHNILHNKKPRKNRGFCVTGETLTTSVHNNLHNKLPGNPV